jgi:two-component system, sensor histidine kinase and response regulator
MNDSTDVNRLVPPDELSTDKILVVDDEENVLFTIATILEQEGYQVDTASNGETAIEKLNHEIYDLVLTDMRMDYISGLDVLEHVHKLSPSTISIVLTGYASFESAIAALRKNAYDYLIKPCIIEDLKHTVKRGLERRRLELVAQQQRKQLEVVNRELERIVDSRTRELLAANQELQEKNRQIEDFVHVVSHDLRSPVVSIQGLSGVLLDEYRDRLNDVESLHYLELIKKSAEQMSALLDDLLQFSRVGRAQLKIEDVDCNLLVKDVWARFEPLHHDMAFQIERALPLVRADYYKLSQIFSNLFDNAIKYRGKIDAPKVVVTYEESTDNWHFIVSNNGPGFDPRFREKIFEIFQRLSDANEQPGSGIGLPIVRKIAQLHGGHAWADSIPGEGSSFHFTLAKKQVDQEF